MVGMFLATPGKSSLGLANRYVDEHWESDYEQGWEALWRTAAQLLKGMKQTAVSRSNTGSSKPRYSAMQNELRTWLKSANHEFEQRLPKNLYRKFGAAAVASQLRTTGCAYFLPNSISAGESLLASMAQFAPPGTPAHYLQRLQLVARRYYK